MVMEICRYSKKRCRTNLVQRGQCWQALNGFPPFSAVLNGRWFDACANLPSSPERKYSYAFPQEPFLKTANPSLIVAANSKITLNSLLECHNLTLAFPANTAVEPDCLMELGYFVKEEKFVPVEVEGDLITTMSVIADSVARGKVDMGITITRFLSGRLKGIKTLADLPCEQEVETGLNNMMRPDDEDLIEWWNLAVKRFLCSGKAYENFCTALENKYNIDALCRIPGKDIDCKNFGGPGIKKKSNDTLSKRINPCIIEECEDVVYLKKGDKFFEFTDKDDRNAWKVLQGSGDQYKGAVNKDVHFSITAKNDQLYRMDRVCVTVNYAKSVKFIFRGGERQGEELDIPVDNEKIWSVHCARLQGFRKSTRVELRGITQLDKRSQQRIRAKGLYLQGCI